MKVIQMQWLVVILSTQREQEQVGTDKIPPLHVMALLYDLHMGWLLLFSFLQGFHEYVKPDV